VRGCWRLDSTQETKCSSRKPPRLSMRHRDNEAPGGGGEWGGAAFCSCNQDHPGEDVIGTRSSRRVTTTGFSGRIIEISTEQVSQDCARSSSGSRGVSALHCIYGVPAIYLHSTSRICAALLILSCLRLTRLSFTMARAMAHMAELFAEIGAYPSVADQQRAPSRED
jgi:hypothetical protein